MPGNLNALSKSGLVDPATVGHKVSDVAGQVKDRVAEFGRATADKINENRDTAASGLDKAAAALHGSAEGVSHLAHATADKLSNTADYVRGHDVNKMMSDVGKLVKNNPVPSLLAAAVIGFLVGRAFSGRDS